MLKRVRSPTRPTPPSRAIKEAVLVCGCVKSTRSRTASKVNCSLKAVKRHSPVSCWHGLFPVGGTRSPHSLEDLADLGQRHGRGAKLGWRKANRGSVDMKQFDSVRVVWQCRPGAPHPSCWSANGAGTVVVFAPAGVTNAARSNLLSGHQTFVLGVTRSSTRSPHK